MDIRRFSLMNIFNKEENFKWYFGLIYLLVMTIPFNHKEAFSVYDPDLVWSKYVLISLSAVGVYFFLTNIRNYIKDPFFIFFLLFVGFQILSLLQTGDFYSSLRLILFQTAITFAYIPVRNFVYERKTGINDLIILYSLVFVPVVIFLALQIYLQSNFQVAIGGVWPVGGYPTRYGSTFWDINHFGAFCSALALILVGFIARKRISLPVRSLTTIVLLFTLISLYLTSSRSSFIGFAVGLIVIFILFSRNLKLKVNTKSQYGLYYFAIVTGITVFLYFLYQIADSLKASLLYRSVSFFSHLFLLKVGIIVGLQNFLLGIGANSFHAYFRNTEWANIYYYIDRAALDLKLPLHNLWLEVLAETGLVSFIVFICFWMVLLVGLYRVYKSKSDYLALGFIGGLVSFLTAGFMYSYKSEFFWFFVLIAAAYVSKNYFRENKSLSVESIKNMLCPGSCDVKRAAVIALSIFTLLVPFIFITHPLNGREVNMFSGAFESNLIADKYTELLILFKYIIGNYTYTGRMLSVLFYFGSAALLFLMVKRYVGGFYALAVTSILFGVANIIEPNLVVSIKFYILFIILTAGGMSILLASFINKQNLVFDLSRKIPKNLLIILCSMLILAGLVSNNIYFKRSYNTDLTFLLELAYNRRLMDKSLIQVSNDIELESIYYFSDEVHRNEKGLFTLEGDVLPVDGIDLAYYDKNLFIFTEEHANRINGIVGELRNNQLLEIVELEQGNYNLLLIEKKSAPPLVYLQ